MFFRLALLFSFLFSTLYGCRYDSCQQKIFDSSSQKKDSLHIAIRKGVDLVYSKKTLTKNVLKYDPFLSLYLIKRPHNFPYPFQIILNRNLPVAVVNSYTTLPGKIVQKQVGLNHFAKFSKDIKAPALVTTTCCSLEGIMVEGGIIQKEYLYRFITTTNVEYGDVGIRVKETTDGVIVESSNPYAKNNPFLLGDKILKMDGKKVRDASTFMQKILFAKLGSKHSFSVLRGTKKLTFSTKIFQRYGGGRLSDTFLEQNGLYFNDKLILIKLNKSKKTYGLEVGDKLVQINKKNVKTQEDLRGAISAIREFSSLLISRNGFEFFVNIKK